ncbi:MAG: polyprenyl synthetase family protein [Saprospiraceae bacterium]|nr:polyprenyl synthetase family protein [Saprospiraceae bacterium]
MEFLQSYKTLFLDYLNDNKFGRPPHNLYIPVDYILTIGGKRIRPLLLLMAADLAGKKAETALPAAMSVEVFHNFTLLHDDIMDEAPLRRGKMTVHEKYGSNAAILSGDVMMLYAYKYLENYSSELAMKLYKIFNNMAIEVCDGQQMDIDFETREDVSIVEYLEMITLKTSVLIGASLQMGALIGGLDEQSANHLYHFGKNVGIAFQMQDDVLDTFGEPKVGKQPGGDIIQNKKTYLYLKTLELVSEEEKNELLQLYATKPKNPTQKVARVRDIMKSAHVLVHSNEVKSEYKNLAFSHLDAIKMEEEVKDKFRMFGDFLLNRNI